MHVAAALDPIGGLLGVEEFPVTPAGHAGLLGWLGGFGTDRRVGIEDARHGSGPSKGLSRFQSQRLQTRMSRESATRPPPSHQPVG